MTASNHFPNSPVGKRFCEFFTHRYNFIEADYYGEEKPEWRTINKYPIEHRNLWNKYLDPNKLIGLSFGQSTNYAMLDIDIGSPEHPYNNEEAFKKLLGNYEDIGFTKYIKLQSSYSRGIHVYFPLPKFLPSYRLAKMMKLLAIRAGFTVKDGRLEIFPNAKAYGKEKATSFKAHRLPLQEGSFILDDNYEFYSDDIGDFLDLAEEYAEQQDIELIEKAIECAYKVKSFRSVSGDADKAALFAADLLEQIKEGWTGFGQTNDLLRVIGTYARVFKRKEQKGLVEYIARTAKSLPGYQKFCRHQHHIYQRAKDWAKCIEKFYYPYGSTPNRKGTFRSMVEEGSRENKVNDNRQISCVERIKQAYEQITEILAILPKKVGEIKTLLIETIHKLSGVRPSNKSLDKYKHLWHPKYKTENPPENINSDNNPTEDVPQAEHNELDTNPELKEHNTAQSKLKPKEDDRETPTPLDVAPEKREEEKPLEPISDKDSEKNTPTPLYMKVMLFAKQQRKLVYRGVQWTGLVDIPEGKKNRIKSVVKSINQNDVVVISECNHTSWFYPDNEDNLLVYVIPVSEQDNWLSGITVKAKDLEPL